MGAWGTGPFDSDAALDYLAGLARRTAALDEDDEIVPGSVDAVAVRDALGAALAEVTEPPAPQDYRWGTCADAYAAAGLVAAALVGPARPGRTGTRLGQAMSRSAAGSTGLADGPDPLGLDSHCGYAALLTREQALAMVGPARAALAALWSETDFLASWTDPVEISEQLGRLDAVFLDPRHRAAPVT